MTVGSDHRTYTGPTAVGFGLDARSGLWEVVDCSLWLVRRQDVTRPGRRRTCRHVATVASPSTWRKDLSPPGRSPDLRHHQQHHGGRDGLAIMAGIAGHDLRLTKVLPKPLIPLGDIGVGIILCQLRGRASMRLHSS